MHNSAPANAGLMHIMTKRYTSSPEEFDHWVRTRVRLVTVDPLRTRTT